MRSWFQNESGLIDDAYIISNLNLPQVFEAELDFSVSKARKKRQDRLTSFQQQQMKAEAADNDQVGGCVTVQDFFSL